MNASVIITTLNRPEETCALIRQVLEIGDERILEVLCVNASENPYDLTVLGEKATIAVRQVHSTCRNQPYQRLLGARIARGELLVFFDDDLTIIDDRIFEFLVEPHLEDPSVVGSGIREVFEGEDTSYIAEGKEESDKKVLLSKILYLGKRWKPGDAWYVGAEPYKVHQATFVEAFHSGNVPCMRKEVFLASYPPTFMPLFAMGKAKGEDKVFSLRANRFGRLHITNVACVRHPLENDTHYRYRDIQWRCEVLRSRFACADAYAFGMRKPRWRARKAILWYALFLIPYYLLQERGLRRKLRLALYQMMAIPYSVHYTWIWPLWGGKRQQVFETELNENITAHEYT